MRAPFSRRILSRSPPPPPPVASFSSSPVPPPSPPPPSSSSLKPFDTLPGPPVLPGVGTFGDLGQRLQRTDIDTAMDEIYREYGPLVKQEFFGKREIWIYHPDHVLEGFRQEGSYPSSLNQAAWPWHVSTQQRGAPPAKFQSIGPEWQKIRRIMQKDIFPPAAAESYLPLLDEPARLVSKTLWKTAKNLDQVVHYATTDLLFSAMLGFNPKTILSLDDKSHPEVDPKDIEFADKTQQSFILGASILWDPTCSPSNPGPNFETFQRLFNHSLDRIDYYFDTYMSEEAAQRNSASTPFYFARLLARGEVAKEEAKRELSALLFAGVDTTASTFLWFVYHLSKNPEQQELVRKELIEVLGEDGGLEMEHLKRLRYLNLVFREVYRMSSMNTLNLFRYLPEDGHIAGYHIPKEVKLQFNIAAVQKDPTYVDQPEVFRPERWSPEAVAARKGTPKEIIDHRILSKPFGFGARMCVGGRLAELELKALLCRVLRDWRIEWAPKEQPHKYKLVTFLQPDPFPTIRWIPTATTPKE